LKKPIKKRLKSRAFSAKKTDQISADAPTRRKLSPVRLGDKLRRIRAFHGLTQGAMLMIINPDETDENNRARVSQYERGTRIPSLIEVYNYAKYINAPLEILLNDSMDLPREYKNY